VRKFNPDFVGRENRAIIDVLLAYIHFASYTFP